MVVSRSPQPRRQLCPPSTAPPADPDPRGAGLGTRGAALRGFSSQRPQAGSHRHRRQHTQPQDSNDGTAMGSCRHPCQGLPSPHSTSSAPEITALVCGHEIPLRKGQEEATEEAGSSGAAWERAATGTSLRWERGHRPCSQHWPLYQLCGHGCPHQTTAIRSSPPFSEPFPRAGPRPGAVSSLQASGPACAHSCRRLPCRLSEASTGPETRRGPEGVC